MSKVITTFFILIFSALHVSGQGCSDAGLCTVDTFKPLPIPEEINDPNKLQIGVSMGVADNNIAVFGGGIGYSRAFGQQWSVDTKLTYLSQGGNDIHVSGLGDIFLNLNYKPTRQLQITMGAKIPMMKADRMRDELPLPMDYQSSLGTLDFLGGVSYSTANWFFAAGVQIPLEQNENAFFADDYPVDAPLATFQSTNMFQRSADLIFRIARPIAVSDKMIVTPGLLPIIHLGEDEYTGRDGTINSIEGSSGLTLNGTVFLEYSLSETNTLEFSLGFPFVVREARPDGLTRGFVLGIVYAKSF